MFEELFHSHHDKRVEKRNSITILRIVMEVETTSNESFLKGDKMPRRFALK